MKYTIILKDQNDIDVESDEDEYLMYLSALVRDIENVSEIESAIENNKNIVIETNISEAVEVKELLSPLFKQDFYEFKVLFIK